VVEEGIYRYNFVQLNADYVLDLAFGLVAEIEHNLISMRTKEALAARKAEGKPLGRKKGNTPKTDILRNQASIISDMKNNGASDKEIYMALGVSKSTYYKYRSKAMSEETTSEACQ
jgi:DNA invertase Pin-like site-specific DNA recombinase